jgi:hypothetical protein
MATKNRTIYPIPAEVNTIPKLKAEIIAFSKSVAYYESLMSLRMPAAQKKELREDLKNSKGILKTLKTYLKKLEAQENLLQELSESPRARDIRYYNAQQKHERAYLPKRKTVRTYKK